jgi:glycosyltransferase involved in cell wall biosynthesis
MLMLSAIVPATGRPASLDGCLAAIALADDPPEETIVVDDPWCRTPAEARNLGAGRASGDVLVFVDADVEVHRDVFTRIRRAFENPGLDALFGSYDDRPTAPGTVSQFRNLLHHDVHQSSAGPATSFWTGLGAVRRQTFLAARGFDGAQRFLEDVDLGMRLAAAGRTIRLDPGLQGTHVKSWSLREMVETDFGGRAVPWVGLLLRERHLTHNLNLGWRHRLSAGASVALAAGVIGRRPRVAAASGVLLLGLNHRFYGLLVRRLGPRRAAVGIGLHALHHLTAVAAIPAGIVLHATRPQPAGGSIVPVATEAPAPEEIAA